MDPKAESGTVPQKMTYHDDEQKVSTTESLLSRQGREGVARILSGAVPISFGFLRFKGLGCRSMGCQSWRKIPERYRTAIERLLMFSPIAVLWVRDIDWGENYPVIY